MNCICPICDTVITNIDGATHLLPNYHSIELYDSGYDIHSRESSGFTFTIQAFTPEYIDRTNIVEFKVSGKKIFQIDHFIHIEHIKPYIERLYKLKNFL